MSTGSVAEATHALPRTASLLAAEDADNYPIAPMMALLGLVAFTDGLDGGLFPAISKALEKTISFDVETLGFMAMVQFLCQAFAGPLWGVLASRAIMTRKQILTLGVVMQGLATLVMWMFIQNFTVLLILRGINGFSLAALRPIANSIVADRFDDSNRGKFFSYINVFFIAGFGTCQIAAATIAEEVLFPSWPTFWGWKLSFVVVGVFTIMLAPAIHFFLQAPPVHVDPHKENAGGVGRELQKIRQLFRIPTFAIIVAQGCFGMIPFRANDFRLFFFQTAGLSNADASTAAILGSSGAFGGTVLGGYIGDGLNKWWPAHGRVLTAELSVYASIPIAFMTFLVFPSEEAAFWWYFSLTFAGAIFGTWPPVGCNFPVLCSIVAEDERALVLAWQTSLEGAVGALGPFIFTFLMTNIFEYDVECNKEENINLPECQNKEAAGRALGYTMCIPWAVCGVLYSTLHFCYPGDLKAIENQRQAGLTDELQLVS